MTELDKKRNEQHRIDDRGVNIFRNSMPETAKESWVYSSEEKDYGIDGQIQITQKEKHTGEFYKVQIKSKKNPSYSKDGKYISVSIDIKSAYFLINNIKSPTALIVVDVGKKKVYWHPIQTDIESKKALENNLDKKSVTIRVSTENIFSKRNYQPFHDYLQIAQIKVSQKAILSAETNFNDGTKFLAELEEKVLHLDGYDPIFRKLDDPVNPNTVFSIGYDKQKMIDYVPGEGFNNSLLPKITLSAKFSKTKAGIKKAKELEKMIKTGDGTVVLAERFLSEFEVVSGNKIIDSKLAPIKGMTLTFGPSLNKKRQQIIISNGHDEIACMADGWYQKGSVHLQTTPDQVFDFKLKIAVDKTGKSEFNFNFHDSKLTGVKQHLRYMNFFRNSEEVTFRTYTGEGFIDKLFSGILRFNEDFNESMYELVSALNDIELISKNKIKYPLPEEIQGDQIRNIMFIRRLLVNKDISDNVSVKMTLKDGAEDQLVGKIIEFTYNPPALYIFGEPFVIEGIQQHVSGKVASIDLLDQDEKVYRANLEEAKISISEVKK